MFCVCERGRWGRRGGHTCHMWKKTWVQLCGVGSPLLPFIAFWALNWHWGFWVKHCYPLEPCDQHDSWYINYTKRMSVKTLVAVCFIFISFNFSNDLAKQNLLSPFKNWGSERHTTCQINKQSHINCHTTALKKTWCYCHITHGGLRNNQHLSWVKLRRNMPTHAKSSRRLG